MERGKGKLLNDKIQTKLKILPYDKHNAMEKILFTEYLIIDELKKELRKELGKKQLDMSKGVVITNDKDNKGRRKGVGDCDLIIYKKRKQDDLYHGLVIVRREFVKGIISISSRLNDLKNRLQFDALIRQRRACRNVVALCRKGKFTGERTNPTLKRGETALRKKMSELRKKGVKLFVLDWKFDGSDRLRKHVGDFDALIKHIRKVVIN